MEPVLYDCTRGFEEFFDTIRFPFLQSLVQLVCRHGRPCPTFLLFYSYNSKTSASDPRSTSPSTLSYPIKMFSQRLLILLALVAFTQAAQHEKKCAAADFVDPSTLKSDEKVCQGTCFFSFP